MRHRVTHLHQEPRQTALAFTLGTAEQVREPIPALPVAHTAGMRPPGPPGNGGPGALRAAGRFVAPLRVRRLWLAVQWPAQLVIDLPAMATLALQFSPVVSLVPPDGLVLEVAGSLNLFGGIEQLAARLRETLAVPATVAGMPAHLPAARSSVSARTYCRKFYKIRLIKFLPIDIRSPENGTTRW